MPREFKLPDLGEGIHEAEILQVFVSEGAEIAEGDPILEVETDKAAVEIPSPFSGVIEKIHIKQGDIVTVGDTLITISGQEEIDSPDTSPAVAASEENKSSATDPPATETKKGDKKKEPVPASPATRRLARELGVDLHAVEPSGPKGLVTARDVEAAAKQIKTPEADAEAQESDETPSKIPLTSAAPDLPDFSRWGEIETVPIRSVRRATARQMSLAWTQIPHVSNQDNVDITRLEAFRKKSAGGIAENGGKLTLTVFALKAAATALKAMPYFNASFDGTAGRIILKKYYHIGVAMDTESGLVVPVIRDVDRKSITDLSVELSDLVRRARDRELVPEDMQGGTFTITNAGAAGGGHFTPIINFPQVAILGMGQARLQPWVLPNEKEEHRIAPRLVMPMVFCFDHRIQDGVNAIRFTRIVKETLEDPDLLLLKMV